MTLHIVHNILYIMKTRYVKTKINEIIRVCGGDEKAAKKLDISIRWLYYLKSGIKKPGKRLYRDICKLLEDLN